MITCLVGKRPWARASSYPSQGKCVLGRWALGEGRDSFPQAAVEHGLEVLG